MFDAHTLLALGLADQVISIWQVFLYIALMIPFLLLERIRLCLLITYLFSYYLAFLVYWREILVSGEWSGSFALYAAGGLAILILFTVASILGRAQPADKKLL